MMHDAADAITHPSGAGVPLHWRAAAVLFVLVAMSPDIVQSAFRRSLLSEAQGWSGSPSGFGPIASDPSTPE
jgi:hypothetical protein